MDDLISRQAAIEAVNNAFDRETLLTGFVRSIAVRAIRDMPSTQPEQRWIPCSERLPEKVGAYLTQALMNGHIFVSIWEGCYWNVKTPIIAWMELPDAYRGR